MTGSSPEDVLFSVRNALHLGAPQTAISEATHLTGLTHQEKIMKDVLIHRAYIELGSSEVVLGEISEEETNPSLQAVRLLAQVVQSSKVNGTVDADHVHVVRGWMENPSMCHDETAMVVAATILLMIEDYETALKACFLGKGLENMAIGVHVLISMNRLDIAFSHAAAMSDMDDDAPLTQLAQAWVLSRQGGRKLQEAYYIYQELGDKFAWTMKLHNGLACCQMMMGRWEDAEAELLQALEKSAKDVDTLNNLGLVSLHLGKTKDAARYKGMLHSVAGDTNLDVLRMTNAEQSFNTAAAAHG